MHRLVVVPEPVDVGFFNPDEAEPFNLPEGELVFGSHLGRERGPYVFLSVRPLIYLDALNDAATPAICKSSQAGKLAV
jgi:hypothetical protein